MEKSFKEQVEEMATGKSNATAFDHHVTFDLKAKPATRIDKRGVLLELKSMRRTLERLIKTVEGWPQ